MSNSRIRILAAGFVTALVLGVALLRAGTPAVAATAAQSAAVARLAKADMFALGGVGFAGTLSDTEQDLWVLLGAADPQALLLQVWRAGTPAARAYALLGLHVSGSAAYADHAAEFLREKGEVSTMRGCIVYDAKRQDIVAECARIDPAEYRKQVHTDLAEAR